MDVEANFSFLAFSLPSLPRCHGCKPKEGINNRCWRPLPSKLRQLPCDHVVTTFQVESRSPDRNESSKEEAASNKCTNNGDSTTMYLDNEVSVTTPLTGDEGQRSSNNVDNEGDLSEVDITSQHNSVISQTPDSTISGPVPVVICDTPGERLCDEKRLNCNRSPVIARDQDGS